MNGSPPTRHPLTLGRAALTAHHDPAKEETPVPGTAAKDEGAG